MINNNLNALRMIAASLVLYGHSFVFLGLPAPLFLSWAPLGSLGVFIFFTISGYLITQSWQNDPHLGRFFIRRALRIVPGLIVCILLSIFVLCPIFTTLTLNDYFKSDFTWGYLHNIALYITYYLPGVFAENRVPNAVNGSLWSLPIEFLMYIIVAIIGFLRGNKWVFLMLTITFVFTTYFWAQRTEQMLIMYASDLRQAFICGTYFWVGATFYLFNIKRFFSLSTALLACIGLLCLERWVPTLSIMTWLLLPITVLAFGLDKNQLLSRLTNSGDYSYGIYIYAFPIQQAVVYLYPNLPFEIYLPICFTLAFVCAILSWHLIERPALALKPRRPSSNNDLSSDTMSNASGH
ncbi:MAG: acyltransferase [Methylococcales bacterium]|nr:acyltransferase [Methylococcales bacterium]